ncbi:hypothetical protein MJG53_009193 [Ovis ammon polii x Ovis aries]|uniref:Uncharacterized protein n=1 Tax=Ovis ammon polii x Ovis aries TaxID=2918886 RepID=A0ACB9UYS2_9CETA|nr:hypothetical protein MJG53_009193 [Ovis ammon polii x Ovis aries]
MQLKEEGDPRAGHGGSCPGLEERDKVQIGVGWGSGLHQRPQDSREPRGGCLTHRSTSPASPNSAGSVLRAHTGAPAFASVCWMTGCPAQGQELGWGLWKLQRARNPLPASACRGHGEVGAPSDVRADPA